MLRTPKKADSNVSDDLSIASNASSVQDVISSIRTESSRRRARVRRIRSYLSLEGSNHSIDSLASTGSTTQGGGIMTVRTQEESLKGGKIIEMRKLRRRMKLRLNNQLFDTSNKVEEISTSSISTADLSVVSFDSVSIREYSLVPGDNPSVSGGPPISLGWDHCERYASALDPYESFREGKRRTSAQMKIPTKIRKNMLLQHGHTQRELEDATRGATKSRLQREYTVKVVSKSLMKNGKLKNVTNIPLMSLWGNNQIDNQVDNEADASLEKNTKELKNITNTMKFLSGLWGNKQTDNNADVSNRSKIKLMG